jgi:hypothetical protein
MIVRPALIPLLLVLLVASTALAQDTASGPDDDLLGTLQRQLRAGELEAALDLARQATELRPALAPLWYNLAGLEAQVGDMERAEAAFERAVTLGFDDFRHADADTDLAGLTTRPAYLRLRAAWADGLAARRRARALDLVAGRWSEMVPLPDRTGGVTPPRAEMRLRVDADGLAVEVLLGDTDLPAAPPWHAGGGGVLLTFVLADDPETGGGRQHVDLGFGWLDGLPAGAVRLGSRWQRVAELSPKIRLEHAEQRLRISFRVPWDACGGLHPLVDDRLGLNAVYLRPGEDGAQAAALLADPAIGRPDRPWRRSVPLTVHWRAPDADAIEPRVVARLDDHVQDGDTASLLVRALLPPGRTPGVLHVVVRDRDGVMVHDADAPLRRVGTHLEADVTVGLPDHAGTAWIGVSLGRGERRGLDAWELKAAVIPPDWFDRVDASLATAPPRERPALAHQRDLIATLLADRRPRADATVLAAMVDELDAMLGRLAATGTSLPAGGSYRALMPADEGLPPLACSLALPEGWRRGQDVRAVAVLARAPGGEQRAVQRAPRLLAERAGDRDAPPIVLAVPHLPRTHDPAMARAVVARLLPWLRDLLGCGPIRVAGVDLLAATVLEAAAAGDPDLAGALMITGVGFTPWPDEGPGALGRRLLGIPDGLPLGWVWFPDEQQPGDQAAMLRRLLKAQGHALQPETAVPGGLGFAQAWSRAVLWAADL